MAKDKSMKVKLGADTSEFDSKMKKAEGTADGFGKNASKAFRNVGIQLMSMIGLAGGAAAAFNKLSQTLKTGVADFAKFETGQKNVQSLLDKTDKQLSSRTIKLMTDYGLSLDDMNKSMFDAVSAGIPAARITEFMGAAAKLSTAGVTELAVATDGLTSVINAYSLATEDAEKVANAFFTAQKFGKTTVAELSQNIGLVAPIAKTAGISYQELLAVMAQLTKSGIRTTEATTAVRAAIVALVSPSVDAKKALESFGIQTGIAAIKQDGFFNSLVKIAKVTRENEDILTQFIPNVRALTGVSALTTEKLTEYNQILQAITKDTGPASSMTQAFGDHMESLAKKTDKANAKVKQASIALGKELAPAANVSKEATAGAISTLAMVANQKLKYVRLAQAVGTAYFRALGKEADEAREKFQQFFPALNQAQKFTLFGAGRGGEGNIKPVEKQVTTLKTLNEELERELENLNNLNVADIRAIALTNERIAKLQEEIETLKKLRKEQNREVSGAVGGAGANVLNPNMELRTDTASIAELEGLNESIAMVQNLESAFNSMFSSVDRGLKGMAQSFAQSLKVMLAEMAAKAAIFALLNILSGGTGSIAKLATGIKGTSTLGGFIGIPNIGGGGSPKIGSSGVTKIEVIGSLKGGDIFLSNKRTSELIGSST